MSHKRATLAALAATILVGGMGYAATAGPVIPETSSEIEVGAEYDRDAFPHWTDPDGNGCDTRDDQLRLALTNFVADGCVVQTGLLADPYTGQVVQFQRGPQTSAQVQVDHVIPLAWAWRHGADRWTEARREAFANDPGNLVVTVAAANREKSDSGPDEWMPPRAEIQCAYLVMWRAMLDRYELQVDAATQAALDAPVC